ncbi:hypothetical protein Tco_0321044 [Tanacetum coccineum]
MLAPKCATYNGRSTFANPKYLKIAQSEKPCLYEIPYDTSDHANRFCPNGEETVTLEKERVNHSTSVSRPPLKSYQVKDKVVPNNSQERLSLLLRGKVDSDPADHAGCLDTRKSTSGGIQFLSDKLVSRMSKKQNCTAMSSAKVETEYQLADMFTKAFAEDRFKYLVRRIGMRCLTPADLEVVRLGINPMIQPEPEDLPKDNPKLEIAVLRTSFSGISLVFTMTNGNPSSVIIKQHCVLGPLTTRDSVENVLEASFLKDRRSSDYDNSDPVPQAKMFFYSDKDRYSSQQGWNFLQSFTWKDI